MDNSPATGGTTMPPSILLNPIVRMRKTTEPHALPTQRIVDSPDKGNNCLVVPARRNSSWLTLGDMGVTLSSNGILRRMLHYLKHERSGSCSEEECSSYEPMDPEELAALNAIINTRRSMAAARALANGHTTSEMDNIDKSYSSAYSESATSVPQSTKKPLHIRFAPVVPLELNDESNSESEAISVEDEPQRDSTNSSMGLIRGWNTSTLGVRSAMQRARLGIEELPESSRRRRFLQMIIPAEERSSPVISAEERKRRRELIYQVRPTGTGMVTLLDGGRVKALQAGNPQHERQVEEEMQMQLWGFAALSQRGQETDESDDQDQTAEVTTNERSSEQLSTSMLPAQRHLNRMAEVCKRHEDEVRALGAEALEMHKRAKRAQITRGLRQKPDPSISLPDPSPLYPRRPDAKGILVVPMEQLGIRPSRPQEGRFWRWDYFEDSDDDDETSNANEFSEEIAEDQRQQSILWKHATSRAAAQEVVHLRRISETRHKTRGDTVSLLCCGDEFLPPRSRSSLVLDNYGHH